MSYAIAQKKMLFRAALALTVRSTFLLTSLLYLSACSMLPNKAFQPGSWPQQQQLLEQLSSWTLQGKLGIRSRSPDKNHSATMHWQQHDEHYQIQINGPFGQGKIKLQGDPGQLLLERTNQPAVSTRQPETLLMQELGWRLPIKQIAYWVKGLPAPDSKYTHQLMAEGVLSQLEQSGWELRFSHYQQIDNYLLPGKIVMTRDPLTLTLIAKQWQFE
jgi:outer membrane lipoprotein LolB